MKDVFKEQMVKKAKRPKDRIITVGIIFNAIILLIVYLNISMFVPVLGMFIPFFLVMLVLLSWHLIRRRNQEFEYSITNNEMDIDMIVSKSRRKRVFSGYIRDIEALRPVGSTEFEHTFSQAEVIKDFSTGRPEAARMEFLVNYLSKRTRIIFEPNEDLQASLKAHVKRGVAKFF